MRCLFINPQITNTIKVSEKQGGKNGSDWGREIFIKI